MLSEAGLDITRPAFYAWNVRKRGSLYHWPGVLARVAQHGAQVDVKARKLAAQTQLLEIEVQKQMGALVDKDQVQNDLTVLLGNLRDKLKSAATTASLEGSREAVRQEFINLTSQAIDEAFDVLGK